MKQKKSPDTLFPEINTSYMQTMTVILLTAVCLYVASANHLRTTTSVQITPTLSNPVRSELPIYSVETDKPVVALTFDAAWGNEDLTDILATLEAHNATATFFVSGDWVERYPDAIQAIHAAGHELGNHGTNHLHMPQITQEEMTSEIMTCHQQVYALTQTNMTVFRAPYSDWNDQVVTVAKSCGYSSINQSVDSVDWKDYGVESIIHTVMEDPDLENGAIILLHNGATYTSAALDELLTRLEAEGYSFVTVSDLIYTDNYTIDHTGRQFPAS